MYKIKKQGGYTLIELIVAVGLFAMVMLLASGAYIMMIGLNRQAQGLATGIDNLSFALETMTRDMRTGGNYSCGLGLGLGDCVVGGSSFSFKNESGTTVSYTLAGSALQETMAGVQSNLTDPLSVAVTSLTFYVSGTEPYCKTALCSAPNDINQPHVTITVSGIVCPSTISGGVCAGGKPAQYFSVETGATMRGSDL